MSLWIFFTKVKPMFLLPELILELKVKFLFSATNNQSRWLIFSSGDTQGSNSITFISAGKLSWMCPSDPCAVEVAKLLVSRSTIMDEFPSTSSNVSKVGRKFSLKLWGSRTILFFRQLRSPDPIHADIRPLVDPSNGRFPINYIRRWQYWRFLWMLERRILAPGWVWGIQRLICCR